MRTWYGHLFFAPSDKIGDYKNENEYPIFFSPDKKVRKQDIFKLIRSRYEGTRYCPEVSLDYSVRVIGTVKQCSSHVIEVDSDLPEEKRASMYLTFAHSEHSPFIPVNATMEKIHMPYAMMYNHNSRDFVDGIAACHFRRLGVLAETDRKLLGDGVRKHWETLEDKYISEFPLVVEGGTSKEITDYCYAAQEDTLRDAKEMFDELSWYNVFHAQKKGDSPTRPLPEKTLYRYWRTEQRHVPQPKIAAIVGAVWTNGNVVVYQSLTKALETAGFSAIVLPYTEDSRKVDAILNVCDAILIGGANAADNWDKRNSFDRKVILAAAKRKIPVLGFCHGHQVINLAFGGTIGRMPTNRTPRVIHKGKIRPLSRNCFHDIEVKPGTFLYDVVGSTNLYVNSSHYYEVKNVGRGLIVSGRSPDGVVEAIEHETLPITGFQFHPETIGDKGKIYNELIIRALSRKVRPKLKINP
jgi:putative glutamine amidotransferase